MLNVPAEPEAPEDHRLELMRLAVELTGNYLSYNTVAEGNLPKLLAGVHATIVRLMGRAADEDKPTARALGKSVTPDFVLCLECGKRFKSMRGHLRTQHGLLPEQYRDKWGLPTKYPMVAPNYSADRSRLARISELGKTPKAKVAKQKPGPP